MTSEQDYAIPLNSRVDTVALYWVSRFGWLRARELGALMWPNTASVTGEALSGDAKEQTQRWMANRVVRRLREQNFVLSRQLPKSGGTAIVLSAAGARYLQRLSMPARPGDKWGRSSSGTWTAPVSWEHELIVTLTLLNAMSAGAEIKTEVEIRAENPGKRKYPDGLAFMPGKYQDGTPVEVVQWIEVESSDKSGAKMLRLARYLADVSRRQAPVLSGKLPNTPVVVYRADMVDLTGKPIDHKNRIVSAIRRHIGANVVLYFQKISFKNNAYHVDEVVNELTTIEPLDLDDSELHLGSTAFFPDRRGTFINTSVDLKGRYWTLKVYKYADRFRWEVWTKPDQGEGEPQERASFHIEKLEDAFRVAIQTWRTKFYKSSF
jgi:hypothetical protein